MKTQLALTLIFVVRLAQAGDPYVRKGYSLVDGSSRNKFIMETGGNTFECDKDCFDDYDDDECDRCTVYGNNNHVYCRKGKVAKSCRQLCCSKYTGGGGGSGQDNDDDFDYGYENYGYEDDDDYDYDDDTDYGYGYGYDNYDRIPDRGEYKWVNTDYSELFDITKNGRKFECNKSCIRDNRNRDCNQCTLYRGWRLKCFKGKISSSCRRECCDQSTNNEIERYFAVDDMYPYDDYNLVTIGPFYNGETYDCRKDCIDENSGRKCEQCYVDHNIRTWRNLFCIDGEIPSSCRRPCCDKNGGDDEYIEVHDYDPYDSGLVTYHEGSMYWCDTDCIWDKQDGKCDLCRVNRGVVECVEGRVHQGCRRACCEYLSNWRM